MRKTSYCCDSCGKFVSLTKPQNTHASRNFRDEDPSPRYGVCSSCGKVVCRNCRVLRYDHTNSWEYDSYYFGDKRTGWEEVFKIYCPICIRKADETMPVEEESGE